MVTGSRVVLAAILIDRGNGIWSRTFTVPVGNWQYKMVLNNDWGNGAYSGNVTVGGDNNTALNITGTSPVSVTFYYDHKTNAVLDTFNDKIAVVAGSFQSEIGCTATPLSGNGDWAPDCVRSLMTDRNNDGIYEFTTTAIPAGSYAFKVARDLKWDTSYPVNDIPFNVVALGQKVTFKWNSNAGEQNAVTIELEALQAGNDNNVEWDGVKHDSRNSMYRTPFGAVKIGTPVTLRLRTFHKDVTAVKTRFYDIASSSQFILNMTPAATNVPCNEPTVPAAKTCDFWTTTITPTQRTVVYYRFIITDGTKTVYYEDDAKYDGGLGEVLAESLDRSYNIYVYDANFTTPEWAKNATIYQIFVERFHNGNVLNDPTRFPTDTYPLETVPTRGWFYPQERGQRFPITPWNSIVPDPEPYTDTTREYWATYSSTMYGGDLEGVTQKLNANYFTNLGVTALYLNPIFDSPSNHKYDGRDYRKVDPAFGGKPAWDALVTAADAKGIKLILDGVPNHVSSDSPFFDRFGRWPEVGACESVNSPYRNWFFFVPITSPDQPVCDGNVTYRAWFGVVTLPQINTAHPEVMAYWFGTPGGKPGLPTNTAAYWIDEGAAGWRIDVVPDVIGVNPTFFETWRTVMKAADPDSMLYSETWPEGDVRDRVLGDEFDSTMNYRYRKAVLGFMRDTRWTDNDGGQEVDPLSPSGFVNAFETMREDYPKPAFDSAMNLIDSHDTNRAVHVLNEKGFTGTDATRQPVDNFVDARRRLGMVAVMQMTLPGAPTIYYGDEVGLTGYGSDIPRDDPYNRQPYPWSDLPGYNTLPEWRKADAALKETYTAAGTLRRQHSFLRTGSFDVLKADDANKVLAYGRRDNTGAAIVVFNRGTTTQNVALGLRGYIPTGATLSRVMPVTQTGNLAATTATTYTFSVAPNSYGVWITPNGADMTAPLTPTNLMATAGNASVALTWTASTGGTVSYNIYRSYVTGGGYELIGNSATTNYNDTTAKNGTRYCYIVKAVDNVGNESVASNEACATPSFPIGYAVLQFPKEITVTLGVTPTGTIYGQVYVAGLTDTSASCTNILAQVGYGPIASTPITWTNWFPMTCNTGYDFGQNNDEYQGVIYPKKVGTFDMLVRFSTNGGLTWTYGDQNGTGTDDPGKLYVKPNSDTTPPAAPTNLRITGWSDDYIALTWNPVPDAALYRIYRSEITGTFNFSTPLAEITAPTTVYTDTTVTGNVLYHYVVQAVDAALNESPSSNEVHQRAELRYVTVKFRVTVPPGTPAGPIYIAGNTAAAFCGQQWNPSACQLTQINATTWEYTVSLLDGTSLEYKYTRGSWDTVEKQADGTTEVPNRMVTIDYGTTGIQIINDTVASWRDNYVGKFRIYLPIVFKN